MVTVIAACARTKRAAGSSFCTIGCTTTQMGCGVRFSTFFLIITWLSMLLCYILFFIGSSHTHLQSLTANNQEAEVAVTTRTHLILHFYVLFKKIEGVQHDVPHCSSRMINCESGLQCKPRHHHHHHHFYCHTWKGHPYLTPAAYAH